MLCSVYSGITLGLVADSLQKLLPLPTGEQEVVEAVCCVAQTELQAQSLCHPHATREYLEIACPWRDESAAGQDSAVASSAGTVIVTGSETAIHHIDMLQSGAEAASRKRLGTDLATAAPEDLASPGPWVPPAP